MYNDIFPTVFLKRRKQIIVLYSGRMTPLSVDKDHRNYSVILSAHGQQTVNRQATCSSHISTDLYEET
jgi:hypothetical protein